MLKEPLKFITGGLESGRNMVLFLIYRLNSSLNALRSSLSAYLYPKENKEYNAFWKRMVRFNVQLTWTERLYAWYVLTFGNEVIDVDYDEIIMWKIYGYNKLGEIHTDCGSGIAYEFLVIEGLRWAVYEDTTI